MCSSIYLFLTSISRHERLKNVQTEPKGSDLPSLTRQRVDLAPQRSFDNGKSHRRPERHALLRQRHLRQFHYVGRVDEDGVSLVLELDFDALPDGESELGVRYLM